jgi:hypothetical protein
MDFVLSGTVEKLTKQWKINSRFNFIFDVHILLTLCFSLLLSMGETKGKDTVDCSVLSFL